VSDDEMVTMLGPDGSRREVSREAAQQVLRDDDLRAWRLSIDACTEAGGVPLGAFNWPYVLGKALYAYEDAERRITAAYEQGKEVGRVNGAARLDQMRSELNRLRVIVASVRDVAMTTPSMVDPRDLAALVRRYCVGGVCYCGGCVL
jgi:hypothetical protein